MSCLPQDKWFWCNACMCLYFNDGDLTGACAKGGIHASRKASLQYTIYFAKSGDCKTSYNSQNGWRWCQKCMCLAFVGNGAGTCPAGGKHDHSRSLNYAIAMNAVQSGHQTEWKWCKKCYCMFYGEKQNESYCAAGGHHDKSSSGSYSITMKDDRKQRESEDDALDRKHAAKANESREREERERRERIERETRERIERETRERMDRERIERETRERIERETRERMEREARERIEREARERIERETRERMERERIERETRERMERERLERERIERERQECIALTAQIVDLRKTIGELRKQLHDEKVARITADIKLEYHLKEQQQPQGQCGAAPVQLINP